MTPAPPAVEAEGGDPYAAYADAPPAPPQQAADPYAAYADTPPPKEPSRKIGAPESFGIGAREGVTFGAFPAIHGLISAGQSEEERKASEKGYESGETPSAASELAALFKGLYRVGHDHLIGSAQEEASKTYRAERERALKEQESAEAQNPKSYLGGQLTSAVATPLGGAAKAATALGRMGRGAVAGGVGGALYGTGGAISEGEGPTHVAKSAGLGALTGAGLGGAGAGVVETGGRLFNRIRDVVQGINKPENVAARQLGATLRADMAHGGAGIDPEAAAAARRSGMPLGVVDVAGQGTRDLTRHAIQNSSEALSDVTNFTAERALEQHPRIRDTIHRMFGGRLDSGEDKLLLQEAARRANRPAYARAYAAGDRDLLAGNSKLEELTSSPSVVQAMRQAVAKWKDWQVLDGYGGVNPGATSDRGGLLAFRNSGRTGVPTFPNIQFWDYTARNLADKAEAARRAGHTQAAARFGGLERELKAELDRVVPEFGQARAGAKAFFNATEAEEAGQKFVGMDADPREARRALAKFNPAERELFARGFADELSQAVMRRQDNITVVKKAFIDSHLAREKINTALGPERSRELEAVLRAEAVGDRTKNILGGSDTARKIQLAKIVASHTGHAVGGAGAVAAFEGLKDTDLNAGTIIGGAIVLGGLRHGAMRIDAKVARKLGEMLISDDPAVVQKAAKAIARTPQLFDALRRGTEAGTRVAAHDIGPAGVGAGVAAVLNSVLAEAEEHHGHHPDDQNILAQPAQQ